MSSPDAGTVAEYPFAAQRLQLPCGQTMSYLDVGPRAAPCMLFVHGNPSWSFLWRQFVAHFAERFRCIAPDHIGMGLSDKPTDGAYRYRLAQRIADLGALVEHCGISTPITLVVHDWGGAIGLGWAAQQPQRIARLVLTNTGAFPLPADKPFPWQLACCKAPGLGGWLVRGLNGFCRYAERHCVRRRPLSPAARAGLLLPYADYASRRAVHRFVQDIPLHEDHPSWACLREVEAGLAQFVATPTRIYWGLGDFVFDEHFLREWQRRLPQAQIQAWSDGGHYITEDYGDEIIADLDTWRDS